MTSPDKNAAVAANTTENGEEKSPVHDAAENGEGKSPLKGDSGSTEKQSDTSAEQIDTDEQKTAEETKEVHSGDAENVENDQTDKQPDEPQSSSDDVPMVVTAKATKKSPAKKSKSRPKASSPDKKKSPAAPKEEGSKEKKSDESKTALLDSPLVVEGKRQRHTVERLSSIVSPAKAKAEIPTGSGQKLGDIEYIAEAISKSKADDLKIVHRVLFNRPGSAHEIRKNIRAFNGFPFGKGSSEYDKKKATLEKWTLADLRSVASILSTEKGTKEEIVPHILDFLIAPADSGKKPKSTSAKKRKASNSRSSSKSSKKKRTSKKDNSEKESDVEDDEDEDGDASDDEEETPTKKSKTVEKSPAKKESASPKKTPTDASLTEAIKKLLEKANLEKVTMKEMCKMVYDKYPGVDLTDRKEFIKTTVKSLISKAGQ